MSEYSHLFSTHLLPPLIEIVESDTLEGSEEVGAADYNLTINHFLRPQTTRWALGYPVAIPESLRSNVEFPPV